MLNVRQRIEMLRYTNRKSQLCLAIDLDRRKTLFDETQTEQLCHALNDLYQQFKATAETFSMHKLTNNILSNLLDRIELNPFSGNGKITDGLFELLLNLLCVQMSDDNKLLCLDILNLLIIHYDLSRLQDPSVLSNFLTIAKQMLAYKMFAGQSLLIIGNYFMKHPSAFSNDDIDGFLFELANNIFARRNLALFQKGFWMLRVMIVSKPGNDCLAALPEKMNFSRIFETLFRSYAQNDKGLLSNPWLKCLVDFLWVLCFHNEFYQHLNLESSSPILLSLLANFNQRPFDLSLCVVFFMLVNGSDPSFRAFMQQTNLETLLSFIQSVLARKIPDLSVEACILLQNIIALYPRLIMENEAHKRILYEIGSEFSQSPWTAWANLQIEVDRTSADIVQLMTASSQMHTYMPPFYQ